MDGTNVKGFEVIIIQSLNSNEIKTGKDFAEGLLLYKTFYVEDDGMKIVLHEVDTGLELLECLEDIYVRIVEEYIFPMIDFEIHGYSDGVVTSNGDHVSWGSILPILTKINVHCKNLLILVLGICKGATIIKHALLQDRAPFRIAIGSGKDLTSQQIRDGFEAFYGDFFFDKGMEDSVATMQSAIGSKDIVLINIESVFDGVVDIERDQNQKRKLLEEEISSMIIEFPVLKNLDKKTLEIGAMSRITKIFEDVKAQKSYFMMEDLRDMTQEKIDIEKHDEKFRTHIKKS